MLEIFFLIYFKQSKEANKNRNFNETFEYYLVVNQKSKYNFSKLTRLFLYEK